MSNTTDSAPVKSLPLRLFLASFAVAFEPKVLVGKETKFKFISATQKDGSKIAIMFSKGLTEELKDRDVTSLSLKEFSMHPVVIGQNVDEATGETTPRYYLSSQKGSTALTTDFNWD